MNDFSIRQGTVYRHRQTGGRFCLIHHNPMALQSLRILERNGAFDCTRPEIITADELISLRRSGEYEESGDLPPEMFQQLLRTLLASVRFPETEERLLKSLLTAPAIRHGIVLFTFDDARFETWLPNLELFREYDAHATFFYSGKITPEAADSIRQLQAAGHSAGLHGLEHRNAPESMAEMGSQGYLEAEILTQLEAVQAAGLTLNHFAYPNNRRNEASDRLLSRYFRRFRAGLDPAPGVRGYRIADQDQAFYPVDKAAEQRVFGGSGIGELYQSTQENIDAALTRAAQENKLIVFFSHAILPELEGVHTSRRILADSLKTAAELGMKIAGFDDLSAL